MVFINEIFEKEVNRDRKRGWFNTFISLFINHDKSAIFLYRVSKKLYDSGHLWTAYIIKNNLVKKYGLHINLDAQIGLGLSLRHVNGVVIGGGVIIGTNATIYQQVTIGGKKMRTGEEEKKRPKLGDNVVIFAGAKIIGNVTIGDNAIIGANSVVIKDVEANSTYAGVPAKRIK